MSTSYDIRFSTYLWLTAKYVKGVQEAWEIVRSFLDNKLPPEEALKVRKYYLDFLLNPGRCGRESAARREATEYLGKLLRGCQTAEQIVNRLGEYPCFRDVMNMPLEYANILQTAERIHYEKHRKD